MKRGEIWTIAGGKDHAGSPVRPLSFRTTVINGFDHLVWIDYWPTDVPLVSRTVCRLMVDKITTVPKTKTGARVGRLADEDMVRLNRAVLVFARSTRRH